MSRSNLTNYSAYYDEENYILASIPGNGDLFLWPGQV
jgi:hypothetical protein